MRKNCLRIFFREKFVRAENCEYNYAVKQIHFPDTMERLIEARKRLVFDEFFLFIMGMQYQKKREEPDRKTGL